MFSRITGHHGSGTGGLSHLLGSVKSGEWAGSQAFQWAPQDFLQGDDDRHRSSAHPSQRPQGRMHQHDPLRFDAKRTEVRL